MPKSAMDIQHDELLVHLLFSPSYIGARVFRVRFEGSHCCVKEGYAKLGYDRIMKAIKSSSDILVGFKNTKHEGLLRGVLNL